MVEGSLISGRHVWVGEWGAKERASTVDIEVLFVFVPELKKT